VIISLPAVKFQLALSPAVTQSDLRGEKALFPKNGKPFPTKMVAQLKNVSRKYCFLTGRKPYNIVQKTRDAIAPETAAFTGNKGIFILPLIFQKVRLLLDLLIG